MDESKSRSNGGLAKGFHPHLMWKYGHVTFGLCIFLYFLRCHNVESESRSNGGLAKDFHPHHVWDYFTWLLDFAFFLYFLHCDNGQSESRSNGGLAKGFHPHLMWKYGLVTFGLCIFFCIFFCIFYIVVMNKVSPCQMVGLQRVFTRTICEILITWPLDFVFFIPYALWK